jgi:hypothetical protein
MDIIGLLFIFSWSSEAILEWGIVYHHFWKKDEKNIQ